MAHNERRPQGTSEEEPLLGGPGDASQEESKPLYHNLYIGKQSFGNLFFSSMIKQRLMAMIGTGTVAQAGAWIVRLLKIKEI